jgi:hypothetical protein
MSVTLDYISADPVPGPVAAQVVAATKPLLQSYDWWAEALFLTHRMHDKRLEGSTRIHLGGYGDVEIPEDEEALMVCRDTSFVVGKLTEWSVSYNISWKLSELGTEVGRITKGVQSSKLSSYLSSLCSHLKLPLTKAPEVLQRHEARKE